MKVARRIKTINCSGNSYVRDQALYKVDPPIEGHAFIVVSAATIPYFSCLEGRSETYIFPANEEGEISDFGEMEGSFVGGLSHATALGNIGYEVQP